jgi:hypothetical protein
MFFGKCIGGGNLYYFWGSIANVVIIFCVFGVMVVVDALNKKQ